MWITDFIRKVVNALFPRNSIEKKLDIKIAVSEKMERAIQLWSDMYVDAPPWKSDNCKTMNLPASIAHEFARLITLENEIEITGSPMADYLNEQFKKAMTNFTQKVELYCAKGGIAMKPYVNGDNIEIDFTQAECFYPTEYDSNGHITGAIFVDTVRDGKYLYTRLEIHRFLKNQKVKDENGVERQTNKYVVENHAYRSEMLNSTSEDTSFASVRDPLREEIPLTKVAQWATLSPKAEMDDLEKPLFVYVRVPSANNVDTKSPLGASVYARAIDAIKTADEQYTEAKFEFDALEAAIDADADLFKKQKDGTPILPTGKDRIFRTYDARMQDNAQPFLREFAPSFRDTSLFNGLDHFLKVVELLVELTYGTISNPTSVEKTAEEIKTSKQRSYSAVSNMQKALDEGLKDLVYAMSVYAELYDLAPYGEYEVNIEWGDGILEDIDKEFQRRWMMVAAGKLKAEKVLAWYFGCSEEEALEMMPDQMELPGME